MRHARLNTCILTAARTGEVIGAQSEEIKDNVWIVPPDRMKASKEHRVPLSAAALAIIETLRKEQGSAYLFPGGKRDKPLSNMAMLALLDRMGRSDLTAHGFRSTFRDWAAECTNYPNEVVEMALAHTINSKVEAAYSRGALLPGRNASDCGLQSSTACAPFCGDLDCVASKSAFRSARYSQGARSAVGTFSRRPTRMVGISPLLAAS